MKRSNSRGVQGRLGLCFMMLGALPLAAGSAGCTEDDPEFLVDETAMRDGIVYEGITPILGAPREEQCGRVAFPLLPSTYESNGASSSVVDVELWRKHEEEGFEDDELVGFWQDANEVLRDSQAIPGVAYEYRARAIYGDGSMSAKGPYFGYTPSNCHVDRHLVDDTYEIRVIVVQTDDFDDADPSIILGTSPNPTIADVEKLFSDTSDPDFTSITEYFGEISAGTNPSEDVPRMNIHAVVDPDVLVLKDVNSGDVIGTGSGAAWMNAIANEGEGFSREEYEALPGEVGPADVDLFLYVLKDPSDCGYAHYRHDPTAVDQRVRLCSGGIMEAENPNNIAGPIHEISHYLGLAHIRNAKCTAEHYPSTMTPYGIRQYPHPMVPETYAAECAPWEAETAGSYGSSLDPLGAGFNHYNAWHKWKLGFLTGTTTWLDTTGENLTGYDSLPIGSTYELDLYPSNFAYADGENKPQMLVVKTQPDDTALIFENQQWVGGSMNDVVRPGGADFVAGGDFPTGIFAYLRPGNSAWGVVESNSPELLSFRSGSTQGLPYFDPYPIPFALEANDFFDPERCIRLRIDNTGTGLGEIAHVRVANVRGPGSFGCLPYLPVDFILGTDIPMRLMGSDAAGGMWLPISGESSFTVLEGPFPEAGDINGRAAIGYYDPTGTEAGFASTEGESAFKYLHDGSGGTFAMVFQAHAAGNNGILFNETGQMGAAGTGMAVKVSSLDKLAVRVHNGSGTSMISSALPLGEAVTEPHFFIFRYDESKSPQWSVFLDQGLVADDAGDSVGDPDPAPASLVPHLLGRDTITSFAFDGMVAEVVALDHYADDAQVAELAQYFQSHYHINEPVVGDAQPPDSLFGQDLHSWWQGQDATPESWVASGSGVVATSTPGEEPTLGDIAGHPAPGYFGPEQTWDGYEVAGTSPLTFLHDGTGGTLAMVVDGNGGGVNAHLLDETKHLSTQTGISVRYTETGMLRIRVSNSSEFLVDEAVVIDQDVPHYFIFRIEDAPSGEDWALYIDGGDTPVAWGTIAATPDAGPAGWPLRLLAKTAASTTAPFDGVVSEIVVVDRLATDDEVLDLAAYFADEYGI